MMDILKTILDPENASVRTQLAEFSVSDGSIVVLLGPLSFWLQLLMMLSMQASVSAFFAVVVYELIVKQRGSTSSYMVGFGFVIPAAIVIPFYFIKYFGVMNISTMVGAAAITVVVPFNCIEAMFDTSLTGIESSLQRYIGYYCSILPFERNPKTAEPIRITTDELIDKVLELLYHMVAISMYFMVMVHFDHVFVPSPRESDAFLPSSIWGLFHWGHLLNNFVLSCVTSQCIDTGTRGIGVIISILSGCKMINVQNRPMFGSQSPSDFWGRRWNLMMHGSFKRGIFKPLVKHKVPRALAMLATFVVSGILHEHALTLYQMKYLLYPEIASPYVPHYGRQLAFFLWNGFVVLLEHALSPLPLFQRMKAKLPKPIITALVLLTVVPISHWFTDEYIRSGFYSDCSMGFPLIIYLKNVR